MRPDLARLPELVHWGGRLLSNGAWWLLGCNAVLIGGMAALVVSAVRAVYRAICPLSPPPESHSGPVSEGLSS